MGGGHRTDILPDDRHSVLPAYVERRRARRERDYTAATNIARGMAMKQLLGSMTICDRDRRTIGRILSKLLDREFDHIEKRKQPEWTP